MSGVYLFAGGGTGGHIFPGLAIAEELRAKDPGARCVFLCSDRALDREILEREGADYCVIPAKPVGMRVRALWRFVRSWGPAVRATRRIISELRAGGPGGAGVQMVAMGGFVAAPAAQGARAEGVPVLLVNMDAVPGKANRWIARRASRVLTSCPAPGFAWEGVPPIVRRAARAGGDPRACRSALGLDPSRPTLLVTGASQGARSINRLMIRLVEQNPGALAAWQVIHQTGAGEDEPVRGAYGGAGVPALVRPFFDQMGRAWGAADLAVSRAGAGSVAEAWANQVPTVFLPYPYHRDLHQRHNARPLEEAGGAVIAADEIDETRNAAGAGRVILELLASEGRRRAMRDALKRLGPADGAARVAAALLTSRVTPPTGPARSS
ncbi:MAG: UDP-N-acetylglucosamine--N-acetylmuramyl-(pentapeptide) pyrophosphoryl-undecaprenol N-acetylglucosamine transferase [Phycisphaerales bacterium]